MMTKLVLRVLDPSGALLGWTAHEAVAKGDGALRASSPVVVVMDDPGAAVAVSVHWCDLNVEVRLPCGTPRSVVARDPIQLYAAGDVIFTAGVPAASLPPVTVHQPVRIAMPVGTLGAIG